MSNTDQAQAPRFPAAKFGPPRLVSRLVVRPRLFDLLDSGASRRLTLVVGAPGAGKSTLVSNWLASRPDRPAAWVNCDTSDSDPMRFTTALIHAMRDAFDAPALGENALQLMEVDGELSVDATFALGEDLEDLPGSPVLVVDDFHLVGPATTEAFGQLVDCRPPSLQIVVASRADPALRLHRLRVAEELVEVRDVALAFSFEEARRLLSAFDLELRDDDVELVRRRTEGWSAGLQMTALSLQADPQSVGTLEGKAIRGDTVAGFFLEEVLYRQPDAVVDFMLVTSVLDELSVPACTALCGAGAAAMIDHLWRAHLFLTQTDEGSRTYRYHHLIREVLQTELHARDPWREEVAHRAAADFYVANGQPVVASRHCSPPGTGPRRSSC